MSEKKPLYIGNKELKFVKKNIATFIDETTMFVSDKQLTYIITTEPKDPTQLRDLVLDHAVTDVMAVLDEHNIRKGDLNALQQAMTDTFNYAFLGAVGKAFGTYNKDRHPDYFQEDITMNDIKTVFGK